jgi:acyl-CoA thioester hydrolase
MPLIHIEEFHVRHYECDAYGHLNNSVYLHYMQQAAIRASHEAGFDLQFHDTSNRIWLPRRTEIEYLRPLFPDDRVAVKTWNQTIRRVIGRRVYEFRKPNGDDLVARAFTDWVFLDKTTFLPARIPPEVARAYNPEYPDIEPFPNDPFPKTPPLPPQIFRYSRAVEFRDIDPMQHLNNAAYLTYAEDCAMHLSEAYGWPLARQLEDGIAFVARKNQIEYRLPALPGDELEITTWLADLKSASGRRYFKFTRKGEDAVLAELHMLWVILDSSTGKPRRLPPDIREGIAPNLAGSPE